MGSKHKNILYWSLPRTKLQNYFVLEMKFTKFLMLKMQEIAFG